MVDKDMIPKKIQNSFLYMIILLTIILHSLSCNYFTEPEPFVNKATHPPDIKYKTATLKYHSKDQLVTGIIYLDLVPDFDPTLVKSTTAFVDSTNVGTLIVNPSYQVILRFEIDTRKWSNGIHDIYFNVYKKVTESDSLWLLGILYTPLQIYKTSLIFDNTPPTAPTNISVTLQNNYAHISWTPTNFNFFHSYVIRRDGNVIAEIDSQSTSTYIDTTLPDFFNVNYEVGVTIGGATAYSNSYNCKQGESLSLNSINGVIDGLNSKVIFEQTNYLTVVSTQDYNIINQHYDSQFATFIRWAKSSNNDTLYFWNDRVSNNILYTYDASTLNILREQPLNIYSYKVSVFTVGQDNKLYAALANPANINQLFIFDKNSQNINIIIYILPTVIFEGTCRFLSVSPDGKTLLAVDDKGMKSYSVKDYSASLNYRSSIMDNVKLFRPDWKNSRIFITRQAAIVEAWDTQTLNPVISYQLPASKPSPTNVTAIFVNTKNLYAAYTISFYNSTTTLLAEYDINSQRLKRSWIFPAIVQKLYGSEKGSYLFAFTSTNQWIVDIGGSL